MNNHAVKLEIDERHVATVTLDRIAKHNAFDEHVIARLHHAFKTVAENQHVRALVLRANGKHFCAGADLDWMQGVAAYSHAENVNDARALAAMLHSLDVLSVPTIARVQGAAMGGGAGLICCCDIAIAADDAKMAFSEVKLGLIPATISPYVIKTIGSRAARHYFLTAERFGAARAKELGMVAAVLPEDQLDKKIAALLNSILQNSPEAMRAAKQLVFDVAGQAVTQELIYDTSVRIAEMRASAQGQEGLSAFLEKRSPSWVK